MQLAALDYRQPSTVVKRRRMPKVVLTSAAVLFAVSVTCCIATWNTPRRFIFLPGGDVGLGFRSYGGLLQWIEYAPWDPVNMDFPHWSIPWAAIFGAELLPFALLIRRRSSRRRDGVAADNDVGEAAAEYGPLNVDPLCPQIP